MVIIIFVFKFQLPEPYKFCNTYFLFLGCLGFIFSNATALSIAPFDKEAGAASALLGSLQMGAGAILSGVISALSNGAEKPMILLMLISACLACLASFFSKTGGVLKSD